MIHFLHSYIVECDDDECNERALQVDVIGPMIPPGWEMHTISHEKDVPDFLYCPTCAPKYRRRALKIKTTDGESCPLH